MSDSTPDNDEECDASELPFAEYEIGVEEVNNTDKWELYHPVASSPDRAEEKAREKAANDSFDNPVIYSVSGPYKPTTPVTITEKTLTEIADALGVNTSDIPDTE